MKKRIGLILFGLMVVAIAAPVYAQFEWKVSGMIDSNWATFRNIEGSNPMAAVFGPPQSSSNIQVDQAGFNKQGQFFNTRGRLKFDAIMGKDASGTIFFETDSSRWGETSTGANRDGVWRADNVGLEVKNLYMDFAIPYFGVPVPMTARVGVQPFAIREEFVTSSDGSGITLGFKADPVIISPFWARAAFNKDFASDSTDMYGVHAIANISKFKLGAYGVFYDMRTYPLNSGTFTYNVDNSFKARMFWFGGYGEGKVGPLMTKADFVMDKGSVKSFGASDAYNDVRYQGWVSRLSVTLPWELFEFGFQAMYASGADLNKTSTNGLPGSAVANPPTAAAGSRSNKMSMYVIPPGSEQQSSFYPNGVGIFYGQPLVGRIADMTSNSNYSMSRGSIGGSWFTRLHAAYKAAPWYKITLLGEYIGDTSEHGNTIGSARKANGSLRDDNTIGWEMGLWNEFQVYKNLNFYVVGAYLFANDALDYWSTAESRNVSMRDPYYLGSALKLTW